MPKHKIAKHRCGALVMACLDHWAAAITVYLEPYPLSVQGEVEALRHDRATYQVTDWGARIRNAYRIKAKPAQVATVLAVHRCGEPIPATWVAAPKPRPKPNYTTEVPF
ncbi:MAG TPA: hypothetical protein VIG24_15810 [Acidimicrobiia bacterium]